MIFILVLQFDINPLSDFQNVKQFDDKMFGVRILVLGSEKENENQDDTRGRKGYP